MPPRTCLVTFTDVSGIRHSVEVQAESVYQAAGLGLEALKGHAWTEGLGPSTQLSVEVMEPAIRHVVTVEQLRRWAAQAAVSPAERTRKDHVQKLLTPKTTR